MALVYPPGQVTPLGDARLQLGDLSELSYVGWNGAIFHLSGGMAPMAGIQNGLVLKQISGLQPSFVLLDNQGARQDGITWLDSLYEPALISMVVEASGVDAPSLRAVVRDWIAAWRPDQVGVLSWFSQQLGEWWMPVRQAKAFPDQFRQSPSQHRRQIFTWTARGDNAFWQGVDSVSQFVLPTGASHATGFNPVTNLGTQAVWPRHLCYGPGTFSIGDGAAGLSTGSPSVTQITFGPLLAGQVALITTQPRLRSVVDLSANQGPQSLNLIQALVQTLIDFVTVYQVPPLLQAYESLFGILPPNGPMYSLLNGRFMNTIPGKADGTPPAMSSIPVGISGGDSASKIVTAITPYRTYPE